MIALLKKTKKQKPLTISKKRMLLNCEIKEGKTRPQSTHIHVICKKNKKFLQNASVIYDV